MEEKPLKLDGEVCIIAQVDADDHNPGAFQAEDVRVVERLVIAFCIFVYRVAVMYTN